MVTDIILRATGSYVRIQTNVSQYYMNNLKCGMAVKLQSKMGHNFGQKFIRMNVFSQPVSPVKICNLLQEWKKRTIIPILDVGTYLHLLEKYNLKSKQIVN